MRTHGRSRDGVELTDELLERCAADAEAGYDVEKLGPLHGWLGVPRIVRVKRGVGLDDDPIQDLDGQGLT